MLQLPPKMIYESGFPRSGNLCNKKNRCLLTSVPLKTSQLFAALRPLIKSHSISTIRIASLLMEQYFIRDSLFISGTAIRFRIQIPAGKAYWYFYHFLHTSTYWSKRAWAVLFSPFPLLLLTKASAITSAPSLLA